MKKPSAWQDLSFSFFVMIAALNSYSQQQFTITSSRANNYCNGTCTLFDVADLNGNPTAVIFITPVEVNGINLNPHPICSYYNGKQWSAMNVDNATIPAGAQFNVQYYAQPDNDHFTHVVTKENLAKNSSYIDHPGLNENPKAQFVYFQNASPNVRGGTINKSDIKFQYDEAAAKWYITNSNGNTLDFATGYNISVSAGRSSTTNAMTANTNVTSLINTASFIPGPKTDNSGQRVFMTVSGKTQGAFTGENNASRMEVTGFEMEMISPRDMASGQATGKRQHTPILIQKATGAASSQFFKAFTTNEQLTTVTFEVYKPMTTGGDVLDYKIILTNSSISYFKQSYAEGQKGFIDSIKFTYSDN